MEFGLRGKVAVVGGSSRGIGKAAAMGLAQEGARVVMFSRTESTLQASAEEIRKATGAEVLAVPADLARLDDVQRVIRETADRFGRLDILVNNAGGPPFGYLPDLTEEQWQHAIDQNLLGVVRMTREALPYLRQSNAGRVINVLSYTVKEPVNELILSNTARLGVVGFAKTLSLQLAGEGITVNNVCPGNILTDRQRDLAQVRATAQQRDVEEILAETARSMPAGRYGLPEEVANLIVFLASEPAAYINGQTILVDGGLTRAAL